MLKFLRLAITTGDSDGIGLEVAIKALQKIGPIKNVQFLLLRASGRPPKALGLLQKKFGIARASTVSTVLSSSRNAQAQPSLIDVALDTPAVEWVEWAAQACLDGALDGLITGPLSKTSIIASGRRAIGHTEILQKISGAKALHMGFSGRFFSVVLATGHIPLSEVPASLNSSNLIRALEHASLLREISFPRLKNLPIGVLGLNPHAGEGGLLGKEEGRIILPFIEKYREQYHLRGPLVPDAAFSDRANHGARVFLAMYHDQGLIPFKARHSDIGGAHVTLGLPFVRTSVDHGTAKDIFGRNMANPASMERAIRLAIRLAQKRALS